MSKEIHRALPLILKEDYIAWGDKAKEYIDNTIQQYMEYTTPAFSDKSGNDFFLAKLRTHKVPNSRDTYTDYAWNIPISFDIETSSWHMGLHKYAAMYIWMVGFNGQCIYGRTWEQYKEFVSYLIQYTTPVKPSINDIITGNGDTLRFIIYIHNLGYEFQFIRRQYSFSEVFTDTIRKPIYALTDDGIEYRDSLRLTGLSLENSCKNLVHYNIGKNVGDLDYTKLRGPETRLTKKEMSYCVHDVTALNAIIKEKMEQDDNDISNIPYTNTGYVRRETRRKCYQKQYKQEYTKLMKELTIPDLDTYKLLKEAFSGGFTHAGYLWANKHIKAETDSIDFTSSYPAVMLSERYPMSGATKVDCSTMTDKEFLSYIRDYACIFRITLNNVRKKEGIYEVYLSQSKCYNIENGLYDNGRVWSADKLTTTITNVDFETILKVYNIDSYAVTDLVVWKWGYLPEPIVEATLEYYKGKTTLKGVAGSEDTYMMMKGMLNSEYGMMVQDPLRDEIGYADDWYKETGDMQTQLDKYNSNEYSKRFTYYAWGVFITAWARHNLWSGILEFGTDYIYSDTDSIKGLNIDKHMQYIKRYNRTITAKINRVLQFYKIDTAEARPKTVKGVEKQIGVWDWETEGAPYTEFKTLGAKRYLVRQGGDLHITVAGIPKEAGIKYLNKFKDPFEHFSNGMTIPEDESRKLISTYIDEPFDTVIKDYTGVYQKIHEESAINLEKASYTMSLSDDYLSLLQMVDKEEGVIL